MTVFEGQNEKQFTMVEINRALIRVGAPPPFVAQVNAELMGGPSESYEPEKAARAKVGRGATALYYVGGFVVIAAMSVFLGTGWSELGDTTGLVILGAYMAFFAVLAAVLRRYELPIPAGLMATVGVALVPATVFALFQVSGLTDGNTYLDYPDYYSYVSSQWFWMEVATLVVGLLTLRWINFSTVLIPVGVALYFAGMDLAELLFGNEPASWQRGAIALMLGLIGLALGAMYDILGKRRHAFWPHLFGLASVIGGVGWLLINQSAPVAASVWLIIGALLIAVGTVMARKVYLTFGAVVFFGGLSWLVTDVLGGGLVVAPVIALLGLSVMALGVLLQRRSSAIRNRVTSGLPTWAQRLTNTEIPVG